MYRFSFEVKPHPGQEDQYIDAWQKGSEIIQKQPGALGTRLFRKIDDPETLVAMADWIDKEARDKGMQAIKELSEDEVKITLAHRQFAEITIIGGFKLSEEVIPDNSN